MSTPKLIHSGNEFMLIQELTEQDTTQNDYEQKILDQYIKNDNKMLNDIKENESEN